MPTSLRGINSGSLVSALNPAQREAVTTTEGPVLVLAGAGTGKTRVITTRVAHLLAKGVPPQSILAVTFTNKAAREMRERVAKLVGKKPEGLTLSTFHALGARLLRAEAGAAGYHGNFGIHDTADQVSLVRTILRDVRGDRAPASPDAVLAAISFAKNRFQLPEDCAAAASDDREHLIARVYERYQSGLRAINCVDFDDLILLPVVLLEKDAEIRARYRERFRYILVDEYQDTNGAQYRFLRALVGPERNLCVVGDDDQSIYGFRGARMENILGFERDFPGARVVKLEENYRSTSSILDLANAVIAGRPSRHAKTLRSTKGPGAPVKLVTVPDEDAEVDFVLAEIQALLARRAPPNDIAILIRAAAQAAPFEEKLRLRRIPYTLVGGQSFFDRKEVRDVIAYWSVAVNPRDDRSLLRILNVPRRGFGDVTIRRLDELARSRGCPFLEALALARRGEGDFPEATRVAAGHVVDLFARAAERLARRERARMARSLMEEASYQEAVAELYADPLVRKGRWASVEDLLQSVDAWERESPGGEFVDFLEAVRLDRDDVRDSRDGDEDRRARGIRLMTLHSAKGLEFPHVFLVGVEEELLPHRKAIEEGDSSVEEERRLLYVGITRAREVLTITQATTRTFRGHMQLRKPSRFLEEVSGTGLLVPQAFRPDAQASPGDVAGYLEMYRRIRKS